MSNIFSGHVFNGVYRKLSTLIVLTYYTLEIYIYVTSDVMKKITKITMVVFLVFVIGMTISMAFAEPASAARYKGKKSLTVTIKDGRKTVKVKCKYKRGYGGSYSGKKGKYIVDVWKGQNKVRYIMVGIQLPKTSNHIRYATGSVIKNR